MKAKEIVERAKKYLTSQYCYWYGGKDNKCTEALLMQLSHSYPSVYTPKYIAKCKLDIKAGRRCIDCSGLVCKAYNMNDIGTSQFSKYFRKAAWGSLKDGMIVYRKGHCGIYNKGEVIEARGVDSDITVSPYNRRNWTIIFYSPYVDYSDEPTITEYYKLAVAKKKIKAPKTSWVVTASSLNVRTGYSTEYPIITTIKKGDTLKWYGYTNEEMTWAYVETSKCNGWVSRKYIA